MLTEKWSLRKKKSPEEILVLITGELMNSPWTLIESELDSVGILQLPNKRILLILILL